MAYGKQYQLRFKNRIQNDVYRCEIWQKGFSGTTKDLPGAETPFAVNWQETEILAPIKSCEFTINFITDGTLAIEDFYSDDDEAFRIDFYFESLSDGSGTAKLLHSGFLIQDGASEPVTDRKHVITLKATDNLALLKNVKWNEVPVTFHYYDKLSLIYFIEWSLKAAGLYSADSAIEQSLPLRIYDNLFENTTSDRGDSSVNDPFTETVLHSSLFQNTDNTWDDCYSILEKILTDLNACLFQAEGCWNITRPNEYQYFDGSIPGTEYIYPATVNALTLDTSAAIARGDGDCYPVAEDQQKSILRPYKYVLNTFNYKQPATFIDNQSLQLPHGATPYSTTTSGDIRYDRYDLATYFPKWEHRKGDDSYLQIETSISQKSEQDRYIVTPGHANEQRNVLFNPIDVTADDAMNFSLQFKMLAADSNTLRFWVRFELFTTDGNFYILVDPIGGGAGYPKWNGPYGTATWDVGFGIYYEIAAGATKTDWTLYDFNTISGATSVQPEPLRFPADGILMIQVYGTNGTNTSNRQQTIWKDIKLDITQYINKSTQIIGQTHQDTSTSSIKATSENDLNIDDSPRNTIAGTLFTNALTNFDHTDTTTGEATGIGSVNFTRTALWHRSDIPEAFRLGNIITQERIDLRYNSKLIVEGTFRNLRYQTNKFISMLSMFQVDFYGDRNFLPASMNINYMDGSFQTKLIEVFKNSGGAFVDEYDFEYLYKTD